MNTMIDRRRLLAAGLAAAAALLAPRVRACEFFTPTLRVTHPWTRVTAADAPYAVICMKFDDVSSADRLIGVITPVASGAEIGSPDGVRGLDLALAPGQEMLLTETGTHVRLTGLRQPLELGRVYPMKLVFERSGVLNAQLSVDFEPA